MRYQLATLMVVVAACGGGGGAAPTPGLQITNQPANTPAPGGLPSAQELCGLLTADDWSQFGYVTAAQPTMNSDGPGNAYCIYAGTSGATGGLELDSFVDVTQEDAEATFDTIADETIDARDITLPGADEAFMGMEPAGIIAARTGRFTFTISLPAGEEAEAQLLALAGLVLARSAAYR